MFSLPSEPSHLPPPLPVNEHVVLCLQLPYNNHLDFLLSFLSSAGAAFWILLIRSLVLMPAVLCIGFAMPIFRT